MPDIINNVINGIYPASGHNIYVCELAPYNNPGLYYQQLKSFGGFRIAKNTTGSRSHLWDLYLLSANMTNRASLGYYFTKRFSNDFKPLYCSNFTDNAGNNIYQPVQNFSGLSVLNHPTFSQYQYSGNFSFNPILSTNVNQQYPAEIVLYRASFIPLYPLLFCSSIPTHKSFGPAFVSSFNISVDGSDRLGDVEISCSLVGGRSVISPDGITVYRPFLNNNYIKMKTLNESDNQNNTVESNNFQDKYRAINLSDCAFYPGLFTGNNAFRDFARAVQSSYSSNSMPIHKIVSMSLSVQQSVDFTFTYPGYSFSNNLYEFYDIAGPRFASLGNRRVTGSIKIFSPQNYSFVNTNASSLTLYFGSVFFYSMKNVDWQQPVVTINPGNGYFIEYNFTVRMTEFTAFNGLLNARVSEFL
jgi:hypothetical protein